MNFVLLITILVLLFFGILFIIWAIILKCKALYLIKNCTEFCNGILKKIDKVKIHYQLTSSNWYSIKSDLPIYEYEVLGNKYTIKGSNGYGFKLGDVVKINYNPKKPKQSYIDGYSFNSWIFILVIGILFMFIALICYLMFMIIF